MINQAEAQRRAETLPDAARYTITGIKQTDTAWLVMRTGNTAADNFDVPHPVIDKATGDVTYALPHIHFELFDTAH